VLKGKLQAKEAEANTLPPPKTPRCQNATIRVSASQTVVVAQGARGGRGRHPISEGAMVPKRNDTSVGCPTNNSHTR
jgi:hypothetical protein